MADLILLKPSNYSAICLFLTKCCFEIYLYLWEEKGNFGCICFVKMKYLVKAKKKKKKPIMLKEDIFLWKFFFFLVLV